MRILIINRHRSEYLGGSEIQCDIIATFLQRAGHDVLYVAPFTKGRSESSEYAVERMRGYSLKTLQRILDRFKPELIYWRMNTRRLFATTLLARLQRVKFVFGVSNINDTRIWHGNISSFTKGMMNAETTVEGVKYLILMVRFIVRHAINHLSFLMIDAMVCPRTGLKNKLPVTASSVIHNSMLSNTVEFRWPRPFILWVSNLRREKNPEEFVALARSLEHLEVDFLMVGRPLNIEFPDLVRRDRPGNLHYFGEKRPDEVSGMLREAELLVHTCDPEGFGNIFIQAWQQGTPTVSVHFDPEDIIIERGLGTVPRSADQLIRDVTRLVGRADSRAAMGKRAAEFAAEQFDPETNIRKYESFFMSVLGA